MENLKVIAEGSGRHCHVTREHLDILFGTGFELEPKKYLSQPGEFLSHQKVTVVTAKGEMSFSIIGPCRKATQIEVSFTDARGLGVTPPIRESGDVAGSVGCKVVGPAGQVELSEGIIVAKRHVHLTTKDAEPYGITDKEIVQVKVVSADRTTIFDDVVARVSDNYAPALHIDFDEVNAAGMFEDTYVEILRK